MPLPRNYAEVDEIPLKHWLLGVTSARSCRSVVAEVAGVNTEPLTWAAQADASSPSGWERSLAAGRREDDRRGAIGAGNPRRGVGARYSAQGALLAATADSSPAPAATKSYVAAGSFSRAEASNRAVQESSFTVHF